MDSFVVTGAADSRVCRPSVSAAGPRYVVGKVAVEHWMPGRTCREQKLPEPESILVGQDDAGHLDRTRHLERARLVNRPLCLLMDLEMHAVLVADCHEAPCRVVRCWVP